MREQHLDVLENYSDLHFSDQSSTIDSVEPSQKSNSEKNDKSDDDQSVKSETPFEEFNTPRAQRS